MTKILRLAEQLLRSYLAIQWFLIGLILLIFTMQVIKSTLFNIRDSYSFLSYSQNSYYLDPLAGLGIFSFIIGTIGCFSLSLFDLRAWRKINFKATSTPKRIWVITCLALLLFVLYITWSSFRSGALGEAQALLALLEFAIQMWGLFGRTVH